MTGTVDVEAVVARPFEQVRSLLVADPGSVLAPGAPHRGRHHWPVTLVAEQAHGVGATHEVVLELGPPTLTVDEARWSLRWEPTAHRRALPAFDGHLVVRRTPHGTRLAVTGSYEPPFGPLGALGDRAAGRRVAATSARHLLDDVVRRIQQRIEQDLRMGRPAPYPPDLRTV